MTSKRGFAPAQPVAPDDRFGHGPQEGMTIREHFALQMHFALLTHPGQNREDIALQAVQQADALLDALARQKQ